MDMPNNTLDGDGKIVARTRKMKARSSVLLLTNDELETSILHFIVAQL